MCYSNCIFENNYSGQCSNPLKNCKNPLANCFEGFLCGFCKEVKQEHEQSYEQDICTDCFEYLELTLCKVCGKYFEKCELEQGICPDCEEVV